MNLFVVGHGFDGRVMQRAVLEVAEGLPSLRARPLDHVVSTSGALSLAAVAPGPQIAGSRRYLHQEGPSVALYHGLPVAGGQSWRAHDAQALLEHWPALPECLSGHFTLLRLDLERDQTELLLDPLGLAHTFVYRCRTGWLVSNSLKAVLKVTGARSADPIGVSSLLAAGWALGRHTLVTGVERLEGGCAYRINGAAWESSPLANAETMVPRNLRRPGRPESPPTAELVSAMSVLGEVSPAPARLALTGGRDSRVVLALAMAAGLSIDCYTGEGPSSGDVRCAREIAAAVSIPHRAAVPRVPPTPAIFEQTRRFIAQTDGLNSLAQIGDWVQMNAGPPERDVYLWGGGGEIGRCAVGLATMLASVAPGLRSSRQMTTGVLRRKVQQSALLRPGTAVEATKPLSSFADQRLQEGWRPAEVLEAYYAFERVSGWAGLAVRRGAVSCDVFSPFTARAYLRYAFALTPEERYIERPVYQLLSELEPTLRDLPFSRAWRPQIPERALRTALWEGARATIGRASASGGSRVGLSFGHAWFERSLSLQREICLSVDQSPLWDFIDKRELTRALTGPPEGRDGQHEMLCRIATAFWAFDSTEREPASGRTALASQIA